MGANAVKDAMEAGALVVDTRTPEAFGEGHIPGSFFAGAGGSFHAWMGWMAPYERDIVIVGGGEWSVDEVVTALRQIGLDRAVGYLEGGIDGWTGELETSRMITAEELAANLDDYQVLDVRTESEWKDGHIESASCCRQARSPMAPCQRISSLPTSRSRSSAAPGSAPAWPPACCRHAAWKTS